MGSAVEIVGDTGALLQLRAQIDRAPKDEDLIALTLLTPLTLVAPAVRRVSGVSGVRGIVGRGEQGTKLGSLRRHPPHEPRAGAHGHRHVAGAGVAPPVRARPRVPWWSSWHSVRTGVSLRGKAGHYLPDQGGPPVSCPLFTRVRGRTILRTSPRGSSQNFALKLSKKGIRGAGSVGYRA